MLINEVQYKVGLTKKSIRYYEEEGLLNPKRNQENDYREYNEEDIKTLKLIKFLRELDVPISEIKKLKAKELSLNACMKDRINKIEKAEKTFLQIKNMCRDIYEHDLEYDTIDITKYSEEMNVLNKRGITLNDYKKSDRGKIIGAVLSTSGFFLFCLFFVILFTIEWRTDPEMPFGIYLFLVTIFGLPLIGLVINLINRIKEIKGGEENVASKY